MTSVLIQGIRGSYSEEAAIAFLPEATIVERRTFLSAVHAVTEGAAEFVVLPIRNTFVGEIRAATQSLLGTGLSVINSLELPVRHVLAAAKGVSPSMISKVYSHPAALEQCSRFLNGNTQFEPIESDDTASSIRDVVEKNSPDCAAIGSETAAKIYGAEILQRGIANSNENLTTFCLISK